MAIVVPTHYRATSATGEKRYYINQQDAVLFAGTEERVKTILSYTIYQTDKDMFLEKSTKLTEPAALLLTKSIQDLHRSHFISERAKNIMLENKIGSVKELVMYTANDLLKFRNFGKKTLAEIETLLIENNLSLGMKPEDLL